MATYRITPRAYRDLVNIGRYSLEMWGQQQRNAYLKTIEKGFELIAENPYIGRPRSDVKEGYYSCLHGSHVIFYIIRDNGVDIIGVPHQRMDIINYFSDTTIS
ncbi:type II toxin-antitoxin system RelE/ParE family toxin [Desulfatiferula olefinivorans]